MAIDHERAASEAVEDYLKAIFELESAGGRAVTKDLARLLDVRPPSVVGMVRRLTAMGLIEHRPYRGTLLTEAGRREALRIIRKHRLLERYLVDMMGLPLHDVHREAHRLEHALSGQLADRLEELLGHPARDPHGSPIPARDGELAAREDTPLSAHGPGASLVVTEVADEQPALLRYLVDLGLLPDVTVRVVARAPFDGPVTLAVAGREVVVGKEVTDVVRVRVLPADSRDEVG